MFKTTVDIKPAEKKISYENRILTFGSCFAENIGQKLTNAFLLTDINPFGVLFNPISISKSIRLLLDGKKFEESDLFLHRSLWNSFSHSTKFSSTTIVDTLELINTRSSQATEWLKKAEFLLVTFGTAWVYENADTGEVVSNCHKLPASRFIRRRMTVDEITREYALLFSKLNNVNPNLRIIFTVSPIRHWKDGAHENNVSKATLLLAINQLVNNFAFANYFPAYEIQMDELRDYRFYDDDMLHPSKVAVDYIWQRFTETYFSEEDRKLMEKLEQLQKDLQHRPIHSGTPESMDFLAKTEEKMSTLKKQYPFLNNRF